MSITLASYFLALKEEVNIIDYAYGNGLTEVRLADIRPRGICAELADALVD